MIKLYSDTGTRDTILELWGASTKHPDSRFFFSRFDKVDWFDEQSQVFQWILECASKLTWPVHAYDLTKFAIYYYETERRIAPDRG